MQKGKIALMALSLGLYTITFAQADVNITYEGPGLTQEEVNKLNYTPYLTINGLGVYMNELSFISPKALPPFPLKPSTQTLSPLIIADLGEAVKGLTSCMEHHKTDTVNVHKEGKTLNSLHLKIAATQIPGGFDVTCEMKPTYQ